MIKTQENTNTFVTEDKNTQVSIQQSYLKSKYNFENLIVSQSNQLAYSVAKNICDNKEIEYNPFIVIGDSSLGKTHLVQSIKNYVAKNQLVIYISAEQFLNTYLKHIMQKTMDSFREKYRKCDILIMEDIQDLANKEGLEEELFYIIEDLLTNNKQIILTSNIHPNKIHSLNKRLLGRFVSGLISEIKPFDRATIMEIIKMKAKMHRVELTSDVIDYIAISADSNIYEIKGIVLKIKAYAQLMHAEIDLASVKKLLQY